MNQASEVEMIPIVDLKKQYESIKAEIDSAIKDVVDSGQFILGKRVEAFEAEFAEPRPKLDHNDDIPDITLLILDTECMDP